jgi:guanosine-3',5'-bis(diphosphate) 3'-pyrophosphohydrolase
MKTLKIKRAREIATFWHTGQVRKYTGQPYIVHPARVAKLMTDNGGTEDQIIAAWLHDTKEDTMITDTDIAQFGPNVVRMVNGMTNPSKPEDGNRAVRQAIDREWFAQQHRDVIEIRIADIYDNIDSIERYDPKFAYGTYFPEKCLMLPTLERAKNFPLFWKMFEIINRGD